ncbi:hypothetical protein AMS68_002915 [Peltaster fructicola]|uniref:Uncharacterized protein n=1 Tax=Peltaster fructicola TaxID=286661 RepID=A0A6H0XRZ7_9PEZI|nr:hypothetical protein AMS68_002915 [Peltaster fructicola]
MFGLPRHGAAVILAAVSSFSCVLAANNHTYLNHALNATDILIQKWWDADTGRFDHYWWQTASIITTLADLSVVDSRATDFATQHWNQTYTIAPTTNNNTWTNIYYDDSGWWALAWIKVYDITQEIKYLDTAELIFEDMITGLGSDCGGQWWTTDRTYTATISNQLFFATAAALGNRVSHKGHEYKAYASGTLNWLKNSGLLTANNTFLDGRDATDGCKLVGPAWTYNQGVILGGLVEYYALTHDKAEIEFAHSIAQGTIDTLTDDMGILTEDGYPNPLNEDRAIFKGIFARNLGYLHSAFPKDSYKTFLQRNADSIWVRGRAKNGLVGPNWQGPLRAAFVTTQASAVDAFIAAAVAS